jgi:hypothetical protein
MTDGGVRLDVRGGPGGMAVRLADLDAAALELRRSSESATQSLARVALVAADPDLAASAVLSPSTAVRVELALVPVLGPTGLPRDAVLLAALAAAGSAAAMAYRTAEDEIARTLALSQDTIMFAVGRCAPQLVVGVLTLEALGVDVAGVLDEVAYDFPGLADLSGGVDGLVAGLATNPWTRSLLVPDRLATEGWDDGARIRGGEGDRGYEDAVHTVAGSAAVWGLLSERGGVRVTEEGMPRAGARAPVDLTGLAADQLNLGDDEGYPGHVRVIEVPQDHGSAWIVEISGTQVWDPRAGDNPFDLTTDVRVMAQESTLLAEGVGLALGHAQQSSLEAAGRASPDHVGPGVDGGPATGGPAPRSTEPVLLAGHSLGGIVAAALASAPRFTEAHRVTHVVTMGSPVGRMPVPAGVEVLSLEHRQDAVPRLDGQTNPDRISWVTVTRDLDGDADSVHTASGAHATSEYLQTAGEVDRSQDDSVTRWRLGSRQFFSSGSHGPPVIRDYRIERLGPPP